MAIYDSKNLINWPINKFLKQICVDIISLVLLVFISKILKINDISWIGWIIYAVKISILTILCILIINSLFYREYLKIIFKRLKIKLF